MRRLAVTLAAAIMLPWTALLPASAQTPPDNGFKTITSPLGYQFEVPSAWRELSPGSVPRAFAGEVDSPDGDEKALVIVNQAAMTAADLQQRALDLPGLISGSPGSFGVSGSTVLQAPEVIQIPNADAAVALTVATTDAQGKTGIIAFRLAIRGQTVFTFGLGTSQDSYQSDPGFGKIVDSFQLTTSSLSPPTLNRSRSAPSQAPAANGLSTITSPEGYQIQVPADWSLQPAGLTARGDDAVVDSADGHEQLQTAIGSGAGITAADLRQLVESDVGDVSSQVSGYSGGALLKGPDQVQVANADGAATLTQAFTDGQGGSYVVTLLVALQGSTLYSLELFAPQDFYNADAMFQEILDSFQLLPLPAQPAPING